MRYDLSRRLVILIATTALYFSPLGSSQGQYYEDPKSPWYISPEERAAEIQVRGAERLARRREEFEKQQQLAANMPPLCYKSPVNIRMVIFVSGLSVATLLILAAIILSQRQRRQNEKGEATPPPIVPMC